MIKTNKNEKSAVRYALAGLLASVPMGAAAMMLAVAAGMGFFDPLRLIASVLLGPAALSGAAPIFVGLALHMTTGAALGAAYGLAVGPRVNSSYIGLAYGVGVWIAATLVLSFTAPVFSERMPHALFAMAHVVYGAALALLLRR